jgi:hypothetical protein
VAHQQVDCRLVLAEHDKELSLLLQVDQLFHREVAAGLGHHVGRRFGEA